jgi:hypothetical protein
MPQRLARLLMGLLLLIILPYPADWAIWQMRAAPMGSVNVSQVTVASLKGNKEEYYSDGTQAVACSQSLFPQAGGGACWWVRRHPQVVVRP